VVEKSIVMLREKGLAAEGLFRVPGQANKIEELKAEFNKGGAVDLYNETPNTVAGLLKLWFRELPEPIFMFKNYDTAITKKIDAMTEEELIAHLKTIYSKLPEGNKAVVSYTLAFLAEVATHSDENKMTVSNISIVFGPNLFRAQEDKIEDALKLPIVNSLTQMFIVYHKQLL